MTSTTMYKATAAAAALPPVQRKMNLFHILINQCKFFIRVQDCFLGLRDFRKEGTRETRLKDGNKQKHCYHQPVCGGYCVQMLQIHCEELSVLGPQLGAYRPPCSPLVCEW